MSLTVSLKIALSKLPWEKSDVLTVNKYEQERIQPFIAVAVGAKKHIGDSSEKLI